MSVGDLVSKRVKFEPEGSAVGIVLGTFADSVLVMWTTSRERTEFKWHLTSALKRVT